MSNPNTVSAQEAADAQTKASKADSQTHTNPLTGKAEPNLSLGVDPPGARERFVDSRDKFAFSSDARGDVSAAVDNLRRQTSALHYLQDRIDHGIAPTRAELDALKGNIDEIVNRLAAAVGLK